MTRHADSGGPLSRGHAPGGHSVPTGRRFRADHAGACCVCRGATVTTTTQQGVRVDNGLQGFGTVGLGLDLTYNMGRHFSVGLKTGGAVILGGLKAEASDGATLMQSSKWSLHGMLGAGGHF